MHVRRPSSSSHRATTEDLLAPQRRARARGPDAVEHLVVIDGDLRWGPDTVSIAQAGEGGGDDRRRRGHGFDRKLYQTSGRVAKAAEARKSKFVKVDAVVSVEVHDADLVGLSQPEFTNEAELDEGLLCSSFIGGEGDVAFR